MRPSCAARLPCASAPPAAQLLPQQWACLQKQTLRGTPTEPYAGPRALTECGRWLPMPPGSSGPGNTSGTAGDRRQRSGQRAARPVRPPPGLSGLSRQHADTSAPSSLWAHLASEPSPTVPTTAPGRCHPGPSTRGPEFHPAACRWPRPCSRCSGQRPLALRSSPACRGCAGLSRTCTHMQPHHVGGPKHRPPAPRPSPQGSCLCCRPGQACRHGPSGLSPRPLATDPGDPCPATPRPGLASPAGGRHG